MDTAPDALLSPPKVGEPHAVYRHPVAVRLFHWVNALAIVILLASGLSIFNVHPRLYLGYTGYWDRPAVFEISGNKDLAHPEGWIRVGSAQITTLGLLGKPQQTQMGLRNIAFPNGLTLPNAEDLGRARGWHFLFVWIFMINGAIYIAYALISKRITSVLLPTKAQLKGPAIARDLWMHLRLKHVKGPEALQYNLLQKLAYLAVLFILMPLMVLTGMTMSNTAVAGFPWLLDLFQGRQTARTLHFVCAFSIVLFVVIHIFQVFVAGFVREMRSILTGYYVLPPGADRAAPEEVQS